MSKRYWLSVIVGVGIIILGRNLASVNAQEVDYGLFFSEYVEGSSNNKAIEIYNPTNIVVSVGELKLEKYVNGSTTAVNINLSTIIEALEPDGVFVLCHTSAIETIKEVCDFQTGSLDFNGDDALVLKDSEGNVLDAIGQTGHDPGDAWVNGAVTTLNQTLIRRCGVTTGEVVETDVFDPAIEWNNSSVDTFTNLGEHTACYSPSITPTLIPTPLATPTEIPTPTLFPTPTVMDLPTPTPEEFPTPTRLPTPTLIEPSPTLYIPTNTPTPTFDEPTPTNKPTPAITPKPTDNKEYRKFWSCEYRKFSIRWGRRFKEIHIPVCKWKWNWFGFGFYPLHKHY